MAEKGTLSGIFPAIVRSYDAITRTCKVEIPAINSGGDTLTEAEILYPIGDKSKHQTLATEIEILAADTVWVQFIGGDSRYPIICGWRNPKKDNSVGLRFFHHANIGLLADGHIDITVTDGEITINAKTIKLHGDIELSGGTLTHDGVNISKNHKHTGVQSGSGNTGNPV